MDSILLKQHIMRWTKSMKFLMSHRSELTDEELSAIDFLDKCWQTRSFGAATTAVCNEQIGILKSSHKYHSNNKDIITNLKDLCAAATTLYTVDETTFNQFKAELKKTTFTQTSPNSRPTPMPQPRQQAQTTWQQSAPRPVVQQTVQQPTSTPNLTMSRVLIKQDIAKWRESMQFFNDNLGDLTQDEINAVNSIITIFNGAWTSSTIATGRRAIETIRNSDKFHGNNRKIIEYMKNIRAIVQRYAVDGNSSLFNEFQVALAAYLKQNPIVVRKQGNRNNRNNTTNQTGRGYRNPFKRSLWWRFDDFITRIGNWFAYTIDDLPERIGSIIYIISWILFAIGIVVLFFDKGFWTAAITAAVGGLIMYIVLGIGWLVFVKVFNIILIIFRLIFYRGWTFLLCISIPLILYLIKTFYLLT